MRFLIVFLVVSVGSFAQGKAADPSSTTKLTNSDVLLMHTSGLGDDVISEKLRTSTCDFDTSPTALANLKTAGISDSVVLMMLRCESSGGSGAEVTPTADVPAAVATESRNQYAVAFVKSDRKWKYGFRGEPYDKISDNLQARLVEALEQQGLRRLPALEGGGTCCLLTIELLEVTTHPAVIKKPGIDVTANLSVSDSTKRILYSKGYRGESRTVMNTWGHLINDAVEDMVKSMANDKNLTQVLATGEP